MVYSDRKKKKSSVKFPGNNLSFYLIVVVGSSTNRQYANMEQNSMSLFCI